ncbi:MAG: RNA polymerase sigma factor, partial [Limisphaerales bacterium]
MDTLEGQALAEQAAAGNKEALEQLCLLLWPSAYARAFTTLRNKQDAEDCTQKALLNLIRYLHRYDPGRSGITTFFGTILY